MKPPVNQQLDLSGAGSDLPIGVRPRYGLPWSVVLLVATLMGLVSSMLAWQMTMTLERTGGYFRWLVVLNCAYWYTWAAFTPSIVWLSQRFRFERLGLLRALAVHLPAVLLFSLAHIGAMQAAQWWLVTTEGGVYSWWPAAQRAALLNLDWEMMTYWAIVGLSHALLYYRESRDRELRASQLETRLVESQLKTLQQQLHPHFLFNTLNSISCLMHRDVAAADRTLVRLADLLRLTLERLGEQEVTLEERARLPAQVSRHRAHPLRRPARGPLRHRRRDAAGDGADAAAPAAGRERDQARGRAKVGGRAHRRHRAP